METLPEDVTGEPLKAAFPFRTIGTPFALFLCLVLAGCTLLVRSPDDTQRLSKRVEAFMTARIQERWENAYRFLDSEFRKRTPLHEYLQIPGNNRTTAFRIETITMESGGIEASVTVRCDVLVAGLTFSGVPEHHLWKKENGDWFLTVQPRPSPFFSEAKPAEAGKP